MTRNVPAPPRVATPETPLVRTDLLRAALTALDLARDLDDQASRRGAEPRAAHLLERLDAHREILARRAGNVAMASVCTAEELNELRDAARILVAVHGWVARRLGLVGHHN